MQPVVKLSNGDGQSISYKAPSSREGLKTPYEKSRPKKSSPSANFFHFKKFLSHFESLLSWSLNRKLKSSILLCILLLCDSIWTGTNKGLEPLDFHFTMQVNVLKISHYVHRQDVLLKMDQTC